MTSNHDKMGLRYSPMAFTEQGVAMLSSVLKSERAIEVNVAIIRAFVQLRAIMATHRELARKLDKLESRLGEHDEQFRVVFDAIRALMEEPEKPKRKKIGFEIKEPKAKYGKKS